MIKKTGLLTLIAASVAVISGCIGAKKVNEPSVDLMVTFSSAILYGAKPYVQVNERTIKKTGKIKVVSSASLYKRLLTISLSSCKPSGIHEENMAALITAPNLKLYIMLNKRIATKEGNCTVPFHEANSIVDQLGLEFRHHKTAFNKP